MIRQMYEDPSNRPPIPHAESDEEDSEPESFVHMWNRTQAVDPVTQKDYWDQAIGSSYYNPVYGGMQSGGASFSEMHLWEHKGKSLILECHMEILMHLEVLVLLVVILLVDSLG